MTSDDRDLVAILIREIVRRAFPTIATTTDTIKERLIEVLDESELTISLQGRDVGQIAPAFPPKAIV